MFSSLANWIRKHQLIAFFVLAYLITFVANFAFIFLNPEKPQPPWSLVWFVQVFGPTFSALIVARIIGGKSELKRLLAGLTRWRVSWFWYFAAAFLVLGPLAIALIYGALGNPVRGLQPGLTLPAFLGLVLFGMFSGPIAEELGWRGFALPRLQAKHNALVSSLILGVIHCCWHLPLFFIPGTSQRAMGFPIYLVLVMAITFYTTWLYNNTRGSLVITILAHFAFNATGLLTGALGLMPPMVFYMTAGPMLALLVVGVVIVLGPRTFSRKPLAEMPFRRLAAAK